MKKLIAIFVALVMLLFSVAALAETKITVNGTGEVRVSADTAIISLGVNARDKDVLKAQQKVNETIAAIRTALIEQGVKEENINTAVAETLYSGFYPGCYRVFSGDNSSTYVKEQYPERSKSHYC